jgi:hypothetical protein
LLCHYPPVISEQAEGKYLQAPYKNQPGEITGLIFAFSATSFVFAPYKKE